MAGLVCFRRSCGFLRQPLQGTARVSAVQNVRQKSSEELPPRPKAPVGGFLAFHSEIRPELIKENPGLKVPESGRIAGRRWNLLSAAEKDHYKPTEESLKKHQAALKKWKESLSDEQLASLREQKARRGKIRLKKRLETLGKPPKPAMSGFAYYVKSQPIERGDAPASMYIKGLSQQWNKMPIDDKEPYEAEATKERTKYFTELEKWEQKMIKAEMYDVVRKSSLPSNIDRKTLKPKKAKKTSAKKKVTKKSSALKKASKSTKKKTSKKSAKSKSEHDEDVSWMKEE